MAGVVDTVSLSLGASSGFGLSSPAVSSNTSSQTVAATAATFIRNPQIIQDPMAGYITEYVNMNSGQVISQAPSAKVVAYLRQGLSADGMPLQSKMPESVVRTA